VAAGLEILPVSDPLSSPSPESSSSSASPSADSKSCRGAHAGHCGGGGAGWRGRGRGRGLLAFVLGLGIGAAFLGRAFAGDSGFGPGFCHRGLGADASTEEVREHMEFVSDRVLDRVDATDAQRQQVSAILDEAAPQVVLHRKQAADLRARFREALLAETVDGERIEGLRKEMLGHVEQGSGEAADALVEVAAVLSPEQRKELVETWDKLHERWGGGHR
jgi:Spy/CpxP family protein refolding chaperone